MISELRSYRGSRDPPQFVLHVMSLNTDTAIVSNRLPASPTHGHGTHIILS